MRLRSAGSFATSLLLHAGLLASGAWILSRSLSPHSGAAWQPELIDVALAESEIELPDVAQGGAQAPQDLAERFLPAPVDPWGGERVPRPDTERRGSGGSPIGQPARNLASSIEELTLDREIINLPHRSQVQRLRTARARASDDDRRATPEPMQMTFVVSDDGERPERRPVADSDPARGTLRSTERRPRGGALGGPHEHAAPAAMAAAGASRTGSVVEQPGAGVADGRLRGDARAAADVTWSRPEVPAARPAVPAATRERPNDAVDSSQEVASAEQALLEASTAGGAEGAERGGEPGPGAVGAGAADAAGSRSDAAGYGPAARRSASDDPRLTGYFRKMVSRVDWQRAFPSWAIAEGRGGVAIVGVTLRPDGSLADVRIVRGSGVTEFDRNVLDAVQRAAPFGPLPKAFGRTLRVNMTFDALNPAVGRNRAGRGRSGAR